MSVIEEALEDEEQLAPFTIADAISEVLVTLENLPLYPKRRWKFFLKRLAKQDVDEGAKRKIIAEKPETHVDWLARMCVRAPEGFGDFPDHSPETLESAIKVYFNNPKWEGKDFALWVYMKWTVMVNPPDSFFRPS
jgi:hypothetical protein